MIAKFTAKLRAWLIDLVREAIRLEWCEQNKIPIPMKTVSGITFHPFAQPASKPVTATPTPVTDKTFEQLQAESIAAQEKYYEPQPQ